MRPFLSLISIVLIAINSIDTAPKSRNRNNLPETLYLSSQNGTNNIQIHLKDIQIIALLTDDAFGDYDYDYDYSDFTIKPNNLSTTTTEKPENQAAPNSTIAAPVSTAVPTDGVPLNSPDKITIAAPVSTAVPTDGAPSNSPDKITIAAPVSTAVPTDGAPSNSPDKITIAAPDSTAVPTDGAPSPSPDKIRVRIIPAAELGESRQATVPEVAHSGRCASGYARDKNGRCRRVRKSAIVPIDLPRFGDFVAKFRHHLADFQRNSQQ